MTNIYEEAYKEAEIKIKKLFEDFKKDLDKIFKECTKKKSQVGEECEFVGIEKRVWESTLNRSMMLEAENSQLKEELSRESYKVSEMYCFIEELKRLLKECRNRLDTYYSDLIKKIDDVENDKSMVNKKTNERI